MDNPTPISALNQYAYCPRRCYLIHAEGEFENKIMPPFARGVPTRVELLKLC